MQNNFTIEQVRNYWNKAFFKYDKAHKNIHETHHQRFKQGLEYLDLKSNNKVLNIWSRTGEAVPYLREKCSGIDLINCEVSDEFIKKSKKDFPSEVFEQTDLTILNFPDNYFDFVLSLETLEHCPCPSCFLKEVFRVLKPNGTLVMSLPPAVLEWHFKIYTFIFNDHGEGPHKFLSSKKVKTLLKEVNFELLLDKGTLLFPIGPKFFRNWGEKIIQKFQKTFIREFGVRQFYVAKKLN